MPKCVRLLVTALSFSAVRLCLSSLFFTMLMCYLNIFKRGISRDKF
jgi:hypothetical protein